MLEFAFVLYLFSGLFKSILLSFSIPQPIDFTVFTAIFLVVVTTQRILASGNISFLFSKRRILQLLPFVLFLGWCILTIVLHDSSAYPYFKGEDYSIKKAFLLITCIIALGVPFLSPQIDFKKISFWTVSFSLFLGTYYLLITPGLFYIEFLPAVDAPYKRAVITIIPSLAELRFNDLYCSTDFKFYESMNIGLGVSQFLGLSFFMLLVFKRTLGNVILLFTCAFLVIMTGGRGPFIFLVLLSIYYLLFITRLNTWGRIKSAIKNAYSFIFSHKKQTAVFLIYIISFILLIRSDKSLNGIFSHNAGRFLGFLHYTENRVGLEGADVKDMITGKTSVGQYVDTSIYAREQYIKESIKLAFRDLLHFIFGYGFGDYAKQSKVAFSVEDHPHNILLEVLVETGFIGLLLFGYLLFTVFKEAHGKDQILFICLVFIFLNTLKSIPLVDRTFFGFIAIGVFTVLKGKRHAPNDLKIESV